MNHKPAMALPWEIRDIGKPHVRILDATGAWAEVDIDPYTVHAANAYPRLIEFVRSRAGRTDADALLRELGEDA